MATLARLRPHLPALLGASLGALVAGWLGLFGIGWNDYAWEAAPAFDALVHGHLTEFFTRCPAYGGSFILRAPFALVTSHFGGGELAIYRAVAVPALGGAALLATWLAGRMRADGLSLLARATAIALIVSGPVAVHALEIGHSEEILGGVLCVSALLAGLGRRPTWAGVLLGLALATKAWALVAVVPVLLSVGPRWWRTALVSAVVCAAVLAPLAIGATGHFQGTATGLSQTGGILQPNELFWFTGGTDKVVMGGDGHQKVGYRTPPAWLPGVTHPLIIVVGLALPLLWLVRRRRRARLDLLLLLALTLHLRCLLDAWNIGYYAVPMLLALTVWETVAERRPPVLALAVSFVVWMTFAALPDHGATPDAQTLFYLAWALPLAGWMGLRSLAGARTSVHRPSSLPAPLPTT